ncbi:uncharacterized protein KQ657_000902 [Scheffersomyces spartinae]|uniref:Uncharacterized protein n=1 Tax=Scheffersomyces spartinae TaxID=45513 RepID=A0A9P7V965_9ASCO|nr:uncharacterized protein KQ657_000902 [Scheffersomyces spartinae]KAG7193148.1 hypothetical protein KQ657_000902 [Scheffersomyces spartinae]
MSILTQSQLKELRITEREEFERKLEDLEMEDDPLQIYVDYISWIHTRYPLGANTESGLLRLLEKCTSSFRDVGHYKNDPRYLKIWLEYVRFAESKRDIFIYLAKKEIGSQLALYYEEFARHLIEIDKWNDAQEILEMGLKVKALPFARLSQSYQRFLTEAKDSRSSSSSGHSRHALVTVEESATLSRSEEAVPGNRKRQKIEVFRDNTDQQNSISSQLQPGNQSELGSFSVRRKENYVVPEKWSGQLLRQQSGHERPISSSKFQVYNDDDNENVNSVPEVERTYVTTNTGETVTVVKQTGKTTERVWVNMQLLKTETGEELCFEEVLGRLMQEKFKKLNKEMDAEIPNNNMLKVSKNKLSAKTVHPSTPSSPTMTMYSKMANHEVINMFNDAAQDLNSEDEVSLRRDDTTTNFDGFVTETVNFHPTKEALEPEPTPPTDREEETNLGLAPSSPFLEMPSMSYIDYPIKTIDPLDLALRQQLLLQLSIPLSIYTTYHKSSSVSNIISELQDSRRSNKPVILNSFTNEGLISIKSFLGKGGYGLVYLGETESARPIAIKMESPASNWEYYILSQVHKRCRTALVVRPQAIYEFENESFMLMDYFPQGTVLDVVNVFKQNDISTQLGEEFALFVASQLLKTVEKLHNVGIIHGDLKADNCLVNIDEELVAGGREDGSIVLIDFGRSVDLSLLPDTVQCVSHWKSDTQDCTAMRNGKPWKYDADYYGIACILHTILFGEYIRTINLSSGTIRLSNQWRPYWSSEVWEPLFDFLLNPYVSLDVQQKPLLSHELKLHYSHIDKHLRHQTRALKLRESLIAIIDSTHK